KILASRAVRGSQEGRFTVYLAPWFFRVLPHPRGSVFRGGHTQVSRSPRPGTESGPLRKLGPTGASTLTSDTTPSPSSSPSRASIELVSMRRLVAHAEELARTTRHPSSKDSGTQCSATCSPTICDHRANRPPTVTSTCQPRSTSSPAAASPSSWGSRPEPASWASTTGRRRRPGRPGDSPLAWAARFARSSARRATSEGSTRPSRLGGSRPARRAPSSDASPDTAHLPTHDVHPRTLELLGHVARHGRRDEHLTGARDEPGEPVPPARVELGEHVVEHEDRLAVMVLVPPRHARGHELVARESQRERERPRLPVARISLRRQAAELEREVVAVRTHEAHPALDLLGMQPAHRLEQPRLEQGRRRRLVGLGGRRGVVGDPVERRDERNARLTLPRADLLV